MRTIRSSILLAIVTGAIAMTSPSSAAPPAAKEVEQLAKRKKLCDQGYRAYCMPTKTNTGKKADTNPRPTAKPQVSHQTHTATPTYKQVNRSNRQSAYDLIYGSSEAEQAAKQDTEGLAAGGAKLKERADRKARCAKGEKLYCPNAITSETNPNDDNTKQVPVNKSNRQRGTKTHTATPAYKQVDKPERRSARDVIYGSSEAEQAAKIKFTQTNNEKACDAETNDGCED
ncbi:MAG: hypothetical protein ACPG06_03470 [Alphaproteobacteria bacterium]